MQMLRILSIVLGTALVLGPPAGALAQAQVNGRVAYIEPGSRTLYFTDGRIVTLEPGATLWVDGHELLLETLRRKEARTQIAPGDEVIVVVTGEHATPVTAAPSAMSREPLVKRGDVVQADDVHIFRRHQSP
jgi:hypothetical protein